MKSEREKVFDYLLDMKISYTVTEHPAVFTIEEMDGLSIDRDNQVVKNLFLRDDKKSRYFLLAVQKDKRIDLKKMKSKLESRPLSFASEKDLFDRLGLDKGSVSPLGILNDTSSKVEVVLDKDIKHFQQVGIHPNDNTATVWLSPVDLEAVIKKKGNTFSYIEI